MKISQIKKQVDHLIVDSCSLLKTRMKELDIYPTNTTGDVLTAAKVIVLRHKDLQAKVAKVKNEVSFTIFMNVIYFIYKYIIFSIC